MEDDVSSIITSQLSLQDVHLSSAFAEKEAQIQVLSAQVDELSNKCSNQPPLPTQATTKKLAMAAAIAAFTKKIDTVSNGGAGGDGKSKKAKRTRTKR